MRRVWTGCGREATIYEYHPSSIAYFAPDFCEAGELKDDDLGRGQANHR